MPEKRMKAKNKLLLLVFFLSLASIKASLDLTAFLGSPGVGSAEEGLSLGIILLGLWSVSFILMVYAIIRGLQRLLAIGIAIVLSSLSFFLFLLIFLLYLPEIVSIILSAFFSLLVFTRHRDLFKIFLTFSIGSLLASLYPLMTILIFSILLAIADLIATLRGPMRILAGSLFKLPEKPSEILVLPLDEIGIGLGDLIVYSSLPASVAINISIELSLITIIGILIGLYLSLYRASKRGIVPALPIPVAIATMILLPFI